MEVPQALTRTPGAALHRQIYMVLLNEIKLGMYADTGTLPKEEALCERFNVSRITVRRTLADLASEGVVERRHGLGTFIKEGGFKIASSPSLSLFEDLRRVAAETVVTVIEVGSKVTPTVVANALGLEPDAKALYAVRVRSLKKGPCMVTEAWVPSSYGKGVTAATLKKHPLYQVLQANGVGFGRVVQEFTAVPADPVRARLLALGVGMPLLKIVRLMYDLNERPALHISIYLSPDNSRILMDIPADAVNTMSGGHIFHQH